MSFKAIQIALLAESTMNVYGAISLYLDPSSLLKLILPPSTPHTDALKSMTLWVAALTLGITPAILMCVPEAAVSHQTAARRILYTTFMGFEACMVGTAAAQLYAGNSGLTDNALYSTMALFTGFTLLRVFFLYVRPSWIEAGMAEKSKTR